MKKLLVLLLSGLLALSLTGCSTPSEPTTDGDTSTGETEEAGYTGPTEMTVATSREVETMDYLVTALASDHEINANLVDGLSEHDTHGNLVPAVAESWSANEDSTVWTFNIREGVKWVTNTGEEYADVTAHDFIAGLRHGAEFKSGTAWLLQGVIEGYLEYCNSDFSDEAFASVGIKAVDDYTLEYTLAAPTPYFDSMTAYAVLYPVNQTFLESMGTGCKLGSPDVESCEFGTAQMDSILYSGPYILSVNDSKSQAVLTKNESYWDAEHVYLEKVTRIYEDGQDPYAVMKGFEQGTYAFAALNPAWEDYATYAEKYADNSYFTLPNASVFGVVFNYNRQVFNETNYATDEALKENTKAAIQNVNVRNALKYAFDRVAYLSTNNPVDLATSSLRNVNNFPTCGTTSEGTTYFTLVEEAFTEMTGETVNLQDGQNPFLSKENALAAIELAKADGIEFPVHLDMLVNETSAALTKQAMSMKQSIEENTDGQLIIELVLRDEDTVQNIAYYNNDPYASDYDISTFTGWSPDYQDPKSFVDIYSPTTGYYMTAQGLGTLDADGNVTEEDIKTAVGYMEYEELYRTADAITDDLDARYAAFAKADAFLIANSLYIPNAQQTRAQRISYVVPFSEPYSNTGISEYKYKFIQLQTELVTAEQYAEAKAAWEAGE